MAMIDGELCRAHFSAAQRAKLTGRRIPKGASMQHSNVIASAKLQGLAKAPGKCAYLVRGMSELVEEKAPTLACA
jgi:hypothetical protein